MISSVKMESSAASASSQATSSYVFTTPSSNHHHHHPTASSPSSSSSSTSSSNFSVDTLLQHQIYNGTTSYTYFNHHHPTYSGYYPTQNGAVYVPPPPPPPPPQFEPNYPVYDRSTILNEKFLNEKGATVSDVQHLTEPNGLHGVKTTPSADLLVYYPVNKENSDTGLPIDQVVKEYTSDDSHVNNQDEMSYDEEDEEDEEDEDDEESENEEVNVKSENIEVGGVLVEEKRGVVDKVMVKSPGKRGRKKNSGKKVQIDSSNFSLQVFYLINFNHNPKP